MAQDTFLAEVENLQQTLSSGKDLADSDLLGQLCDHASSLSGDFDKIMTTDRDLKLGIVGRVKAGKSSFLNALLFKGEDRLPRAATPMTAALTRITYTGQPEEQEAIIHFYSKGEWDVIRGQAREFLEKLEAAVDEAIVAQQQRRGGFARQITTSMMSAEAKTAEREEVRALLLKNLPADMQRLKGCLELVEMAEQNNLTHASLPGAASKSCEHSVRLGGTSDDFFENLNDFVGAQGKFTPMVKYLQLRLHHPDLEGIEIVDTPGLNDPVTSRVDVTNRFLKNCDAVLLLSGVGRFLDANDADLAGRQFGEASVKRAYIIGTMVDMGMMECPKRNISIEDAYGLVRDSSERQAESFIGSLEKQGRSIPKGLRKEDNEGDWPILVSSMFYGISRKMAEGQPLDSEEQHVLNRLAALFYDYREKLKTPEDFEDVACFEEVRRSVYAPVQEEKEEILEEKISSFRREQAAFICRQLEDILISCERRKKQLEKNDRESLKTEQERLQDKIEDSRIECRNIFDEMIFNCKNGIKDLKVNMRQAMAGHKKLKIRPEVKTRSWSSGLIFKDYHSEVYTENHTSSTQATNNLEEYGQECMRMINSAYEDIFNAERLERRLRTAITDAFKSANEEAAKADVLGPVQSLMNRIGVPEVSFDAADNAKKRIYDRFSNDVCDGAIADLEKAQSEQLTEIYNNYADQADKALQQMIEQLTKSGATFVDEVGGKIAKSYEKLEEQLRDKEKSIQQYRDFGAKIKSLKDEFAKLGG